MPHRGGGHHFLVGRLDHSKIYASGNYAGMECDGEVAHSLVHSPSWVHAPTSLESIVEKLRGIQANMDIIREHRYEDRNDLVAYMNEIQFR